MKKLILTLIASLSFMQPVSANQTLTGTVVDVHDGDTITVVTCDNFKIKIRMAGIDAPEIKQEYGVLAQSFLKTLLLSREVKIVTDKQEFDPYGRILGYVYQDTTFVNLKMISEGLAVSEEVPPNMAHVMEFNAGEQLAAKGIKGFWKTGGLKQRPRDFRKFGARVGTEVKPVQPSSVPAPDPNPHPSSNPE
jgi:endonuclease YncB( thermonuclease family)